MAYNPSTDEGRVRLLVSDTDDNAREWTDAEITAALSLGGTVHQAAAILLRALAGNEARLLKKIETHGLKTDGPALSRELRELANDIEAQGAAIADGAGEPFIIEVGAGIFGARRRRDNERLRRL